MKIQTFIFVHNQDIILDFIKNNKFNELSNLRYVFLGSGDTSKLNRLNNVIIAKNLPYNMEEYPKLTSYTGWYAIWKNNLVKGDYINLFEYDINVDKDLETKIINTLETENIDVFGYIPFNVHHYNFLKHLPWCEKLINSLKSIYNINITEVLSNFPPNKECSMTSNHTMSKKSFEMYMEWIDKMIKSIRESNLSGHEVERSISVFYLLKNLSYKILVGSLIHYQFDSHQTQGIGQEKFINNYKNLIEN
jgi:hypothetical protein